MLTVHRKPARVLVIEERDRVEISTALEGSIVRLRQRIRTLGTCPEAGDVKTIELRRFAEHDLGVLSNLAACLRDD